MSNAITHIITGLGVGGAERALHTLLTNGLEGPFRNHVISLMGPGHYGLLLQQAGIPVTCLHMRPGRPSLRALSRLRAAIRAYPPRIIQGWMTHGNLSASMARRLFQPHAAVAWNSRSSLEGLAQASVSTRALTRLGARLSSDPEAILYNALRSRRQHAEIGFSDLRAHYLPNGFDTGRWQPDATARAAVRAELGLSEVDRVIGFVGRGHPDKDPANLFQAFAQVAMQNPHTVLVAVGRDLDQFGVLPDRVILIGQRDDMPRVMPAFDLLCLSSRIEGFPNVIGEAMATGVPCVTTDVGDAAAIVGDTGWVLPSRNSDALARALIEAIEIPPEELRARGAAARARIEDEFSIASVVAKYIALYERLIEERR
jgi:glycosyltransferase involved in cell wall biosynthesis